MDLRNAASFFRDPRAVVTNWLLPLKVSTCPSYANCLLVVLLLQAPTHHVAVLNM
jgi:hypothetical protein